MTNNFKLAIITALQPDTPMLSCDDCWLILGEPIADYTQLTPEERGDLWLRAQAREKRKRAEAIMNEIKMVKP